jgi:3-dehydroquinate dehydratase-2
MKIALINGVNLNFLGIREPEIYGKETLSDLEQGLIQKAEQKGIELICFQSNSEGELVDFLQKCYYEKVDGILFNPGAFTHYSYALADGIKSISIPVIEVHISNIHAREEFRTHSVTARNCKAIIGGFGLYGYSIALDGLIELLGGNTVQKIVEK